MSQWCDEAMREDRDLDDGELDCEEAVRVDLAAKAIKCFCLDRIAVTSSFRFGSAVASKRSYHQLFIIQFMGIVHTLISICSSGIVAFYFLLERIVTITRDVKNYSTEAA
ncbi:hypothetical protein QQP08_004912, partial [Theobroma cacao]